MNKIVSAMITMVVLSSWSIPQVFANENSDRVRELVRTQRQIQRSLQQARRDTNRLSELKLQLQSVQQSIETINKQNKPVRRFPVRSNPVVTPTTAPTITPTVTTTIPTPSISQNITETGKASYYGPAFNGKHTASGEIFNDSLMTAAHLTLPFGTKVRVTDPSNGKSIEVIINDRGPHVAGRIIDLTSAAFSALQPLSRGVINIQLEVLP